MGVEIALGIASLVTGVIGGVAQYNASNTAAANQKSANAVAAAQTEINALEDRRQRIREDRVRRAQIIAASTDQGTNGSSGQSGAVASLDTNFATLIANSSANTVANTAINKYNQAAADAEASGNLIRSITNTAQNSFSTVGTIFDPRNNQIF